MVGGSFTIENDLGISVALNSNHSLPNRRKTEAFDVLDMF
jgi:hypothetical protein